MKLKETKIEECWQEIKAGVEHVKQTINAPWSIDDVFDYCREGHAAVFTCEDGFVILEPKYDNLAHRKQLLLWIAYGKNGSQGLTQKYAEDIDLIAKSIGADSLIGVSPRPGWSTRAKQAGWHYKHSIYEKEVQ